MFENVLVVIFLEIWLVGISSGPIDAVWGGVEVGQQEYAANILTSQ